MEKICVHIGLALFAIKGLCESHGTCYDCPMRPWCKGIEGVVYPDDWDSDRFPNIAVLLELTSGDVSDTIELAPQIE